MGLTKLLQKKFKVPQKVSYSLLAVYDAWEKNSKSRTFYDYFFDKKIKKRSKWKCLEWCESCKSEMRNICEFITDYYYKHPKSLGKVSKSWRKEDGTVDYKSYIQSPEWKKKKDKFVENERECAICGTNKSLVVHHVSYKNLGNETTKDIAVLCWDCHTKMHNYFGRGASFGWKEIKEFGLLFNKEEKSMYEVVLSSGYKFIIDSDTCDGIKTAVENNNKYFSTLYEYALLKIDDIALIKLIDNSNGKTYV